MMLAGGPDVANSSARCQLIDAPDPLSILLDRARPRPRPTASSSCCSSPPSRGSSRCISPASSTSSSSSSSSTTTAAVPRPPHAPIHRRSPRRPACNGARSSCLTADHRHDGAFDGHKYSDGRPSMDMPAIEEARVDMPAIEDGPRSGCVTPTRSTRECSRSRIHGGALLVCPPAPKKKRRKVLSMRPHFSVFFHVPDFDAFFSTHVNKRHHHHHHHHLDDHHHHQDATSSSSSSSPAA